MLKEKFLTLWELRYSRKYEILLVSFFVLIFGDIFFHSDFNGTPFLIIQNVFAGTVFFSGKKRWRLLLMLLLTSMVVLEVINLIAGFSHIDVVFAMLYIVFSALLSVVVYSYILSAREVTFSVVAAVLCGFIMLSLIGGYFFIIIEVFQTGSFRNLNEGAGGISDLIYFSFITVLTIGYGEITPLTSIAKNAVVFFGLLGHFYSVVVIGVIIGKYISKRD